MSELKKKVLVLSSIYPADDLSTKNTPVVHYFCRQWVTMGCPVVVVHLPYNFPFFFRVFGRLFSNAIKRHYGVATIRTSRLKECEYVLDGVVVKRFPIIKTKPHGRCNAVVINKVLKQIIIYLDQIGFKPDVITGHWGNPQLELLYKLKKHYNVPVCFVDHLGGRDVFDVYQNDSIRYLDSLDYIGFRSQSIRDKFLVHYKPQCPSFMCYSGIPEEYLSQSITEKNFEDISSFVFCGTLIKRKYPAEIIPALADVFADKPFIMNYIGIGQEEVSIKNNAKKYGVEDRIVFHGYKKREQVVSILDMCSVFIMISRKETFGLVYLEAMGRGCITVASRGEGFDGIIVDGYNGFLCEAGNSQELSSIIQRIRLMPKDELNTISRNAMNTARTMTDRKVAQIYLNTIIPGMV